MSNIKIYLQDFNAMDATNRRGLVSDWTLPRKFVLEYTSKHLGEEAAEEAYHIFNAPEEMLDEDERLVVQQYRGHSLSVGDVVQVDGIEYLCAGSGWQTRKDDK